MQSEIKIYKSRMKNRYQDFLGLTSMVRTFHLVSETIERPPTVYIDDQLTRSISIWALETTIYFLLYIMSKYNYSININMQFQEKYNIKMFYSFNFLMTPLDIGTLSAIRSFNATWPQWSCLHRGWPEGCLCGSRIVLHINTY